MAVSKNAIAPVPTTNANTTAPKARDCVRETVKKAVPKSMVTAKGARTAETT